MSDDLKKHALTMVIAMLIPTIGFIYSQGGRETQLVTFGDEVNLLRADIRELTSTVSEIRGVSVGEGSLLFGLKSEVSAIRLEVQKHDRAIAALQAKARVTSSAVQ